jgi:hypothetical protein
MFPVNPRSELRIRETRDSFSKTLNVASCFTHILSRGLLWSHAITAVQYHFFTLHSGGWNQGPLDTAAT